MRPLAAIILCLWSLCVGAAKAQDAQTLNIYIDADFTINWQSAQSIEHGLNAALSSHDYEAAGYRLQIIPMDHRTNARRSIENIRGFDSDESGIAVIGGVHSPVYIRHLEEILDLEVPLLLSWSASAILTRHRMGPENWVFRLSVDDRQVSPFLAREIINSGCQNVGMAVLDNGWGHGNLASITSALQDLSTPLAYETTLATEIGSARGRQIAAELSTAGIDCLGLVGNFSNSAGLMLAIEELGIDVQIFSHWGILAGGFQDLVPHEVRTRLGLRVVQSCGLTPGQHDAEQLRFALDQAGQLGWDYAELSDVPAPAGFVHAFDLGLLFVAAMEQAAAAEGWTDDIQTQRQMFRDALESLQQPVRGILRTYETPFSMVSEENSHGHEALSGDDLCLAQFDERGRLRSLHSPAPLEEASLDR